MPPWPDDAPAAVSLTFDVDAEAPWLGLALSQHGPSAIAEYARLTTLSAGRFGIVRGLPRILDLLEAHGVQATFYIPGYTAQHHPAAVRRIAEGGHEIGHHGYLHLRSVGLAPEDQRAEIERGVEALEACVGVRPAGYRSPSWEITPETFRALTELGFTYDSSLMGDDRAYIAEVGDASLLELPVHWSLDDWPYFGFLPDAGGNLADPELPARVWRAEFEAAVEEARHVTYTMHPEVMGRGYRFTALRRMIEQLRARSALFVTHGQLAELIVTSPTTGDPAAYREG